jgi:hypothetical protein
MAPIYRLEKSRFEGSVFQCENGQKIPSSAINDDYCDCGDDEPGKFDCRY